MYALFPLGSMHKTDVRALARTLQLPTADKDESMGLCFVGERGSGAHAFARFLDHYVISEPGDLVTPEGHVLGQHRGLHTLTIGQRARIPSLLERYYVAKKDPATRRITVVPGKTHPMLQCVALDTDTFAWHTPIPLLDTPLLAQVRYRQNAQPCIVQSRGSSGVRIAFEPSMQAVSPGQTVVVYDGQVCVGSGTIDRVYTEA
ncbi:tRNA-5-taurinomethyluridine 2-sulfurtransferase [Malassezia pachydermatis]